MRLPSPLDVESDRDRNLELYIRELRSMPDLVLPAEYDGLAKARKRVNENRPNSLIPEIRRTKADRPKLKKPLAIHQLTIGNSPSDFVDNVDYNTFTLSDAEIETMVATLRNSRDKKNTESFEGAIIRYYNWCLSNDMHPPNLDDSNIGYLKGLVSSYEYVKRNFFLKHKPIKRSIENSVLRSNKTKQLRKEELLAYEKEIARIKQDLQLSPDATEVTDGRAIEKYMKIHRPKLKKTDRFIKFGTLRNWLRDARKLNSKTK